jgi:hypothetical protein
LLEFPGPRFASSPQGEPSGASRGARIAARRSPRRQRPGGPTQPASVGAGRQRGESLTRVRGSTARQGVPARRIGCRNRRTTPRSREARNPAGKRARGRGPRRRGFSSRRNSRRPKGVGIRSRGGKTATPDVSRAGRLKWRPGQRSSIDGRHPGSCARAARSRGRPRADLGDSGTFPGRASDREIDGEATRVSEVRSRTRHDGKTTPAAMFPPRGLTCRPTEATRPDVKSGGVSEPRRVSGDGSGADEARVRVWRW